MIHLLAAAALATDPSDDVAALRAEVAALRSELSAQQGVEAPTSPEEPENDRVSFTQSVVVQANESVSSAVSFAGDVRVLGRVTGEATAFGGDVVVGPGATVDGDATAFGGRVVVEPGGVVHGDRVSLGGNVPAIGPVVSDDQPLWSQLYRRLVLTLSLAGAGVLAVGVFPARVSHVARAIEARPFHSAAIGTLASGFIALFSVLLTVVTLGLGLPIALMLLFALFTAWMLGFVGLAQAVGDHLPFRTRPHGRWVAFLISVLLLTSAGSLPWVGWLVLGAAGLVGIGASLATRFGGAP